MIKTDNADRDFVPVGICYFPKLKIIRFWLINRLCEYQFCIYNFGCSVTDIIHPTNPFHLVFSLKFFCYILFFGKLFYHPKKHILCLLINLGKVAVQLTTRQKVGVKYLTVLLEVA